MVPWVDPEKQPEQAEGIVALFVVDSQGVWQGKAIPFQQGLQGQSIYFMNEAERAEFYRKLNQWSAILNDEDILWKKWEEEVHRRLHQYYANLFIPNTFFKRVVGRLGLLSFFKPQKRVRLYLENYLRCDAHREALIDALEKVATL